MFESGKKNSNFSLRILIVEDDFYSRRLLQRILAPYGECDIAVNGKEAVDAYERSLDDEFSYDLICLDILMPVMDGHEALKKIRDIEDRREIYGENCVKVLMTSALDDSKNMLSAFSNGCDGYITKPITKKQLLSKVSEMGLLV